MKVNLTVNDEAIKGGKVFKIQFELECPNPNFRDNVADMITQALAGATIQREEPEQKPSALGFHKEDEEDDEDA